MTNEERIYELCGCVIDLIDMLQCNDRNLNNHLEYVRDALADIRQDIDNWQYFYNNVIMKSL